MILFYHRYGKINRLWHINDTKISKNTLYPPSLPKHQSANNTTHHNTTTPVRIPTPSPMIHYQNTLTHATPPPPQRAMLIHKPPRFALKKENPKYNHSVYQALHVHFILDSEIHPQGS